MYFYSSILHLYVTIMPLYMECFVTLSEHESWCNVKYRSEARKWRRTGIKPSRDSINACNLKMISLALNKNSLNTDQSSIDRITVQQSLLCIKIIFSRLREKVPIFGSLFKPVHMSQWTNAYSLFSEWNIILSWLGNSSFHLVLGIVWAFLTQGNYH